MISQIKTMPSKLGVDMDALMEHAKIDGIDFSQASDSPDNVQVKLDYLSQIVDVEGSISSPQIKPFLLNTLQSNEDSYAIKSKTLDIVKSHLLDPEIKTSLIYTLTHDKNPLIRMKAMTVLANIAGAKDVNKALIDRLKNDETAGIRFKALDLIEESMGREIITVLKTLKDIDKNPLITNRINAIFEKYGTTPLKKQPV